MGKRKVSVTLFDTSTIEKKEEKKKSTILWGPMVLFWGLFLSFFLFLLFSKVLSN